MWIDSWSMSLKIKFKIRSQISLGHKDHSMLNYNKENEKGCRAYHSWLQMARRIMQIEQLSNLHNVAKKYKTQFYDQQQQNQ